ncbi:MAG: tRNA (guanine-N2)-dimethyltransferase [Candidatus Riflebacteria bacterium]|nr:tRNA (guanine-N2)-dimethyltransferase [Candidatus Riflebacteria bacterium]
MSSSRRIQRISQALHRRQLDLVLAFDRVHDPHNLAAVLRTADATGIPRIIWEPDNDNPEPPNPEVARGTERWVELKRVSSLEQTLKEYKNQGFGIAATHLSARAVDFRSPDWTRPWVIVMGNEKSGCAENILALSDENVILPMMGLVQSLNVSVATAVILYEIQRQREAAGMYRRVLPLETVEQYLELWHLREEGVTVADLITPPPSDRPLDVCEHVDGRSRTPRWKKSSTSTSQSQENKVRRPDDKPYPPYPRNA